MLFKRLPVLALLGIAYGNVTNFDDEEYVDEDFEYEIGEYSDGEKERFIYGTPGEEDYNPDLSEEEIAELEQMWQVDLEVQQWRGGLQGWKRGYYKDYDYDIPDNCFDRDSVRQIYYLRTIFDGGFDADKMTDFSSLAFMLYYMVDYKCEVEQYLYDLSNFCFTNNCEGEQLLQNEMNKVFQVTGALNALAAIYYAELPDEDQHMAYFDMYSEVGLNIGKLFRYTMNFDPDEAYDWMISYEKRLEREEWERQQEEEQQQNQD